MKGRARRRAVTAPSRRAVPWKILLAAACLVVYGQTVGFGFVRADDTDLILANQAFLADLANAPRAFSQHYFAVEGQPVGRGEYYRPLVVLSFMLDAQIGGTLPWGYHATNVVLHIVAVLLFFRWLRALGVGPRIAGFGALVFAVHPLTTSAVAWIVGRNDVLLAVLAFGAMLALVRWLEAGARGVPWAHLTWFGLALLTKEPAVLLPALAWLYTWAWADRPRALLRPSILGAYVAVVGIWVVLRHAALGASAPPAGAGRLGVTVLENLAGTLTYFGKAWLPVDLGVMPSPTRVGLVTGALALAALAALLLADTGVRRKIVFGLCWCLALLAPGLLVPDLPAYEHRAYLPLTGLIVSVAAAWAPAGPRPWASWAAAAVAIVFGAITATYARDFADPFTYWRSATTGTTYAPRAYVNLGKMFEEQGNLERAAAEYRAALDIDPSALRANGSLGIVLMKLGRTEDAGLHFAREVALHPEDAEAHYNVGVFRKLQGRSAEAIAAWEEALDRDPGFVPAYGQLIEAYRLQGRTGDAGDLERRRAEVPVTGRP